MVMAIDKYLNTMDDAVTTRGGARRVFRLDESRFLSVHDHIVVVANHAPNSLNVASNAFKSIMEREDEPLPSTALMDQPTNQTNHEDDDEHEELLKRAQCVASYLGFESFDSLADWVSKGDALKSRLGCLQSTPRSITQGSSSKRKIKSSVVSVNRGETRDHIPVVQDSPLLEKGKGRAMVIERLSSSALQDSGKENQEQSPSEMLPDDSLLAENERLRASSKILQNKLKALQEKYDILHKAKLTAEDRYKRDYKRWDNMQGFLRGEGKKKFGSTRKVAAQVAVMGISLHSIDHGRISLSSSPSRQVAPMSDETHADGAAIQNATTNYMQRIFGTHEAATAQEDEESLLPNSSQSTKYDALTIPKIHEEPPPSGPSCTTIASGSRTLSASGVVRRGRYSNAQDGQIAINAEFEINREVNGGVAYQYDEVVRDRDRRQRMHAADCDCCKDYYDLVKPVPARNRLMWKSPTPLRVRKPELGECSRGLRPEEPQILESEGYESPFASPIRGNQGDAHRQLISRHRHVWAPPATPPDYWTIDFPDTQKAAEINKKAADMHVNKRRRIEREAQSKNGRFVRRDRKN
ncbi:hypothetical protein SCHPADRAFT_997197 [Schizopora paradoxa]|uniref:DNA endonuclease activator Ctp1 C-terminal domain-containing protein n=1 Tax=Schizopora paradoxa TaxID=27342 RepID=A0A0H2RPW4_9AGAM|nr:hypothetical protein SCHPADRAFT_997197 [Schizopora paradoxa]